MLDVKQLDLQYITNAEGEKTAVVVPIQQFQQLLDDIQHLSAATKQRTEAVVTAANSRQTRRRYSFIGVGQTSNPKALVEAEEILERESDVRNGCSLKE